MEEKGEPIVYSNAFPDSGSNPIINMDVSDVQGHITYLEKETSRWQKFLTEETQAGNATLMQQFERLCSVGLEVRRWLGL